MTKIKIKSYGDKTQKLQMGEKKVELWQNLNCDKTQIVIKLKLGQKSSCDKRQSVKINKTNQFDKTQIVTKLKNSN